MKILIADDEYYTVELVNSQLDWKLLGIDHVLMAYNGAEAIEIFDAEKPEIVLCDIDMPKYDGMEVLEHVQKVRPETKFIFLTCFEKFDYVQKAMRLGAFDYLTKPFSEPDVYASVMKAAGAVRENERRAGSRVQRDNYLIGEILSRKIPSDRNSLERVLSRNDSDYRIDGNYRAILACLSDKSNVSQREQDIYHFVFENIHAELFTGNTEDIAAVGVAFEGIYGLLKLYPEDADMAKLLHAAQELSVMIERHLHCAFTCVIGDTINLWDLADTLDRMKARARRQLLNSVQVGMMHTDHATGETDVTVDEEKVRNALEEQDVDGIVEYLRDILDGMQQKMQLTPTLIHQVHTDFMQIIFSFCSANEIAAHDLFQNPEIVELQRRSEQLPFYLVRCIELVCVQICALLQEQKDEHAIVDRIAEFVGRHYCEPIGRDEIAAELHYSKNYLSRLFRKQIGVSVRDYINGFRIDAAKKMLRETDAAIGDIALDVGFDSMTYFSTVFRKNTNMTPAQYRREKQNNV